MAAEERIGTFNETSEDRILGKNMSRERGSEDSLYYTNMSAKRQLRIGQNI